MTEFKVGDKVRVVNVAGIEFGELHYYDGFETEVAYTSCDGDVYLLNAEGEKGVYINKREIANGVIELIEPKPTKKQRITALEKTVASLTEQLQALQQRVNERFEPSTVVVEVAGDTASLAKAIEETSVKTANELRAEIIEKAKLFVDENGADYTFKVDEENRTVFTYELFNPRLAHHFVRHGFSKCHQNDVFNTDIGKAIALGRAKKIDVSEFENAVQPNEVTIGTYIHYVESNEYQFKRTVQDEDDADYVNTEIRDENNPWKHKIINDTNAQYGGGE